MILCVKHSSNAYQEIRALRSLVHPFIIHYFGGFEVCYFFKIYLRCLTFLQTNSFIGLVFEFAGGGELYNRMKKNGPMKENEAKFYFCEMATVLHYLHDEHSIVYRYGARH